MLGCNGLAVQSRAWMNPARMPIIYPGAQGVGEDVEMRAVFAPEAGLALKRVLVTHPDERGGERFASPLVRSGQFVVRTAHGGFDAAVLLLREMFDAILLHPRTPGMDLRRTLTEIRGQTPSREAGILVILGQMDDPDRTVLRRAGVMDFCRETEPPESLIGKVSLAAGIEPPPKPISDAPRVTIKLARKTTLAPATKPKGAGGRETARPLAPTRRPAPTRPTVTAQDRMSGHLSLVAREGSELLGLPPRVSRLDFLIPDMRGDLVSKEVLAIDLSLAVTVLRMANSVTFGTRSPILGLGRALTRLGQRTLANHFLERWKARQDVPAVVQGFLLGHAWRHNLMVACLAEEISRFTKQGSPDAYFSAGLLHDVGKLLFAQHYPDVFLDLCHQRRVLEREEPDDALIRTTEKAGIGIDHGMLGYELCQGWNLPPVVAVGCLHHHVGTDGPWMKLHPRVTRTVAVANLIDHHVERRESSHRAADCEAFEVVPETGEARIPRPEPRHIPYLRMTPLPRAIRGTQVPVAALRAFPAEQAPAWVADFLNTSRMPVVRIYERAQRRLYKASVQAGLTAA